MENKKGESMELKTTLNEETTRRYQAIKKHSGLSNDKELLAILISREYHRIERLKLHKVFMPKEIYALVEKAATARGETVDEYIGDLTDDILRKSKEGAKHEKEN